MGLMEAWKEPVTLLRRAEPKRDPLGVTFRSRDVQEIALAPALVATTESDNREGTGEDYQTRDEVTLYWGSHSEAPREVLPGDRVRLRGGVWEPVGSLVEYPLGLYLRLRKETPRER